MLVRIFAINCDNDAEQRKRCEEIELEDWKRRGRGGFEFELFRHGTSERRGSHEERAFRFGCLPQSELAKWLNPDGPYVQEEGISH